MSPNSFGKVAASHNTRSSNVKNPINGVALSDADVRRFWSRVERGPRCWLWRGSVTGSLGYGQFGLMTAGAHPVQKNVYAHRLAWALSHGPIPGGQHVLHSCDVPRCVNPEHLFLGTQKSNMEDAARKGRLHAARPGKQKLTSTQVADIRTAAARGERQIDLARAFGVSESCISQIVKGIRRQYDGKDAA